MKDGKLLCELAGGERRKTGVQLHILASLIAAVAINALGNSRATVFRLSLHASSMLEISSDPSFFLLRKAQNLLLLDFEPSGAKKTKDLRRFQASSSLEVKDGKLLPGYCPAR